MMGTSIAIGVLVVLAASPPENAVHGNIGTGTLCAMEARPVQRSHFLPDCRLAAGAEECQTLPGGGH